MSPATRFAVRTYGPDMTSDVCIANIGPRQRRRRLWMGVAFLAAGAALAVGLTAAPLPRIARLLAALPFWTGLLGVFQYREKT